MSLPPAVSCKHNNWMDITVHTAKCDLCHQNNRSVMQRCRLCNMQFCRRCITSGKVPSTNHVMDKSKLDSEANAYRADPDPIPSTEQVQKPTPRARPKPSTSETPSKKRSRTTEMEPPNHTSEGTPTKMAKTSIHTRQPSQFSQQRPQMDDEEVYEEYEEYDEEELISRFPFSHQTGSTHRRPRSSRQHHEELYDEEYEEEKFRVNRPRVRFSRQQPEEEEVARHEHPVPQTGYHLYPDGDFIQYELTPPPPSRPLKEQSKPSTDMVWQDEDYDVATPKKASYPKYTKGVGHKLPDMPKFAMNFNIPKLPGKAKAMKTNRQPPASPYEYDETPRERHTFVTNADRNPRRADEVGSPRGRVAFRPGRDDGFSREEPQSSSRIFQQAVRRENETSRIRQARVDGLVTELGESIDPAILEELRGKSVEDVEAIIAMAKIIARR